MEKKVLIIGAGAVGLVYGYLLSKTGASITFLVKENQIEQLRSGVTLFNINADKTYSSPLSYSNLHLITALPEKSDFDMVLFCISSVALQTFDFGSLKNNIANNTSLVCLQPGLHDYSKIAASFSSDRIVEGQISVISFALPLTGEATAANQYAFWFPPFASMLFVGSKDRVSEISNLFKQAGIATKKLYSRNHKPVFSSTFLVALTTVLALNKWSFSALRKNETHIRLICQLMKEIATALASYHNKKMPFGLSIIGTPWVLKLLLRFLPSLVPFDLETFIKNHFTKVKQQTDLHLNNYYQVGKKEKIATEALELLLN